MKQIKNQLFTIITASLMLSLYSCAQQPGPLGEETIGLDDFDFTTPISAIFPESYVDSTYGSAWFQVPSCSGYNLYHKEECFNFAGDSALWVTYQHQSSCSADEYLSMAGRPFPAANFATTSDVRIFAVGGSISGITQDASDDFIARLSKSYGEPVCNEESFGSRVYNLYTWTLEDRTVKYAAVTTDEHNVLKIEHVYNEDGSLADIREGKRRRSINGYIFVIDAAWRDRFLLTDCAVSGDFSYCR